MDCNFHIHGGIYARREGDCVRFVRAVDFDDPGKTIVDMSLDELASVVASMTPNHEANGSFAYARDFLATGAMYCGGCGSRMLPDDKRNVGHLSIVDRVVCSTCYLEKFKPLFDYALAARGEKR